MKNRKNYLKARKKQFKWRLLGDFSDSKCPKCGHKTIFYFYKYETCCCISCNEWLTKTCGDPDCPFCSQRPKTPYEAYDLINTDADNKNWRRNNYQHKTDGMRKHQKQRAAIDDILNNDEGLS